MDKPDPSLEPHTEALKKAVLLRLKEIREAQNLSYYRLAKMSGLNERGIAFIERGENTPTMDTLIRLAFALNVKVSEIFHKAEETLEADS